MFRGSLSNLEAGSGKHVANISSGLAPIAVQEGHMLPYSVSKSALNSTMKSLSVVLKDKVRVNLFSPGWVQTDMGGPEAPLTTEQSAAALFRNMTGMGPEVTGRFINLDGVYTPW